MNSPSSSTAKAGLSPFRVVVLFEDSATRDHAGMVCTHLVENLADEVEFQFAWWRFDDLFNPRAAWDATDAAMEADMIVFTTHAGHEMPAVVRHWAESWIDARNRTGGAIAGLVGLTANPDNWVSPRHQYLAQLAERAGMDYLPQGWFNQDAVSAGKFSEVADKTSAVTPVLREILTSNPSLPPSGKTEIPPAHWGLNE